MSADGFSILLAFDRSDSECEEEFCMGFECGRLWTLAQANDDEFTEGCHIVNAEMLLRIGEALGREVSWEETRDGHAFVTFGEVSA